MDLVLLKIQVVCHITIASVNIVPKATMLFSTPGNYTDNQIYMSILKPSSMYLRYRESDSVIVMIKKKK